MSYTICIDGGRSKTLMQVLNDQGYIVQFAHDQEDPYKLLGPSSNINSVGPEGVRKALQELFTDTFLKPEAVPLHDLISRCRIVAGMAGVGIAQNKQQVRELFKEWGVKDENLYVMSDIDAALEIVKGDGVALRCGTGSIAKGKKGQRTFRAGGLGPVLGDEGSAHKIGLELIRTIAAEEYRVDIDKERLFNPDVTKLKKAIYSNCTNTVFHVSEIRTLIPQLKEITPAQFALLSPCVFIEAHNDNPQAIRIIKEEAHALNFIIKDLEEQSGLTDYALDLHGRVFKGPYPSLFIKAIREVEPRICAKKIENKAFVKPIIIFAQDLVIRKKTFAELHKFIKDHSKQDCAQSISGKFLSELVTKVCTQLGFTVLEDGRFRPEKTTLTPEEEEVYGDLGKLFIFCIRHKLVIGKLFDPGLFCALSRLCESFLYIEIGEDTIDEYFPLYNAMRSHYKNERSATEKMVVSLCEQETVDKLLKEMPKAITPCMAIWKAMKDDMPKGIEAEELEKYIQGT